MCVAFQICTCVRARMRTHSQNLSWWTTLPILLNVSQNFKCHLPGETESKFSANMPLITNINMHFLKYTNCSVELSITMHAQNVSLLLLNKLQDSWKDWHYFEFTDLNRCNCFRDVLKVIQCIGLLECTLFFDSLSIKNTGT